MAILHPHVAASDRLSARRRRLTAPVGPMDVRAGHGQAPVFLGTDALHDVHAMPRRITG
jgi:hypothetical protein